MFMLVAAAGLLASEVIALVNGHPITRANLRASLGEPARQSYDDAIADLQDYEHAAVRDFLGRGAVAHDSKEQGLPADSIYSRILSKDFQQFDANLRNRVQHQRERVYEIEKAALDALMGERLFEAAARDRGMSAEQLTAALSQRVGPVTPADVEFIKAYENSKQKISASLPPGESRLEAAIKAARIERLRAEVIDSVRTRSLVGSRLSAPRITVSTAGAPTVGSPAASVRIVVFTDFECPYCRESEQTLAFIREKYGDRVALYYLNFPLPTHPHARSAAVASECAAALGRYAAYHDVLFEHQQDLAHADYVAWAAAAGLDRAKFKACLASGDFDKRVDQDIREGIAAGVDGTPTFLVNGRLVSTNDELLEVVAEESPTPR